ncbi:SpoIIE family protein phosphatase [Aminipila butyrica]|uniref:SpoIIE family protein phosphatase n=1 Tax=Aminipila butyrica TaxID=433296 RepID=A0A858BZF3_9FIRM|nr:SpoIIE family protein phosphatase [Aminipila butyrica]QIB70310.1 SpoIIE family protein phosphatase [Aminipila butyrica]
MEMVRSREKVAAGLVQISGLAVMSFLVCRVVVLNSMFPCGIALVTVLMYRNRLNLYLLLPMVLGSITYYGSNYLFYGDMTAMVLCAAAFALFRNRRIELPARGVIAGILTVTCNCAYYILQHMSYRLSIFTLLTEVMLIFVLIFVFNSFFSFVKLVRHREIHVGQRSELGVEKAVGAAASVGVLLLSGTGLWALDPTKLSLPLIGALFVTLLGGYAGGIGAGLIAGAGSAITLVLCTGLSPSVVMVFLAGGFTAGVFSQESRFMGAICFSGACLVLGMITAYPELSLPPYEPLAASAILALIPRRYLLEVKGVLSAISKDQGHEDLENKQQIVKVLDKHYRTYDRLANLYGNARSNRAIIAYQFRGMAQVTESLRGEIESLNRGTSWIEPQPKFRVRAGHASYGQVAGISGDSFQYKDISGEEFGILISDGMGKGQAASAESTLAVSTLMDLIGSGFDVKLALKTVNNILLQQEGQEIFSTVDLALIDRMGGKLRLFKIGAAATFIKRGDKVAVVKMAALPMGIVDGLHVDFINLRLRAGDQIIMISDGVSDANRQDLEMDWLKDVIRAIKSSDPQTISDLIMNRAVEAYGIRERDDMTVVTAVLE